MNRQLTCSVSPTDTPAILAQELVHYGFINEVGVPKKIRKKSPPIFPPRESCPGFFSNFFPHKKNFQHDRDKIAALIEETVARGGSMQSSSSPTQGFPALPLPVAAALVNAVPVVTAPQTLPQAAKHAQVPMHSTS